jgi:hypothetical protein
MTLELRRIGNLPRIRDRVLILSRCSKDLSLGLLDSSCGGNGEWWQVPPPGNVIGNRISDLLLIRHDGIVTQGSGRTRCRDFLSHGAFEQLEFSNIEPWEILQFT